MDDGIIFAPYLDVSPPSADEFKRLRWEIGEAVSEGLDENELRRVRERRRVGPSMFVLCRHTDLDPILCRASHTISAYETGGSNIPPAVMHLMRLVHERVTANPEPAREALRQHLAEQMAEWLTPLEAGELLGVKRDRVRRLIRDGELDADKDENRWKIDPDDAERLRAKMDATLTTTEAADLAGIRRDSVTEGLRKGTIEGEKIMGRWFVDEDAFRRKYTDRIVRQHTDLDPDEIGDAV